MTAPSYGATREEWIAWRHLITPDILPRVANPNRPVSPKSVFAGRGAAALSKVPSNLYQLQDGSTVAGGIKGWESWITSPREIDEWMAEPDLGICLVTRTIHAIDCDIETPDMAEQVRGLIIANFGVLPERRRGTSSSMTFLFRETGNPKRKKLRNIDLIDGTGHIEILQAGQHTCVAGLHPSGERYTWPDGIPESLDDIPQFTWDQIADGLRDIAIRVGADKGYDPESLELKGEGALTERMRSQVDPNDPEVAFLRDHGYVTGESADGKIYIRCPWPHDHDDGGADITKSVFFPAGLGGRARSAYHCMHATCGSHQADGDAVGALMQKIGYYATDFEAVDVEESTRPDFQMTRTGVVKKSLDNLVKLMCWKEQFPYEIALDSFLCEVVIREKGKSWRAFTDTDYTRVRIAASRMMQECSSSDVREAVSLVAETNVIDSGIAWAESLKWDGVKRISAFHTEILGVEDTPYHRAVSLYMWTALAGRILKPGVKADMIPVFVGAQGIRKSTLVHALAPTDDRAADIDLRKDDADIARKLTGKMVAEIAELRGLSDRNQDAAKAWVTLRTDEWIPKFKEKSVKRPRRFLPFGTANRMQFVSDPTGARRWLPVKITKNIDTAKLKAWRLQLWAEALVLFRQGGVQWEEAERLGREFQKQVIQRSPIETKIEEHLRVADVEHVTTMYVMEYILSLPPAAMMSKKYLDITESALILLGYEKLNAEWVKANRPTNF